MAVRRARALDVLSRYAGATSGRRGSTFTGGSGSANTEIGRGLVELRNRSREMVRDTWLATRIMNVTVGSTIGWGVSLLSDTGNDRLDARVNSAFNQWAASCDVTNVQTLDGVIETMVRSMLEGGDTVLRMLDRGSRDSRRVPLALQLWEGDVIDHYKDGTLPTGTGRQARLGVELGPEGQRLGYHLFPQHPGEMTTSVAASISTLVPRAEVVHLFKTLRPGQVRGVPLLAPILLSARDLDSLLESTIIKSKVEASFSAFITQSGEYGPVDSDTSPAPNSGPPLTELRPGTIARLREGENIEFANPSSASNFESVANSFLYGIAAGAGITFSDLTGDLRQANYSSLRAGRIMHRILINQLRWLTIAPQIQRIVDRWSDRAIIAGVLQDRADGYPFKMIFPPWEKVDPLKDLQAEILAVRSGQKSPTEFVAESGSDPRAVMADLIAFLKILDDNKIVLDIDPRHTAQSGIAQPTDKPSETPP